MITGDSMVYAFVEACFDMGWVLQVRLVPFISAYALIDAIADCYEEEYS